MKTLDAWEDQKDTCDAPDMARVEALIRSRLGGRIQDLHLERTDKGLFVRGRTRTYYAKQLVSHAVMDLMGIPIVANEIEVS
jgi:hypothetical protein